MDKLYSLSAPVGRVLLASLFLISGITKITAYDGNLQYMQSVGLPGGLLPLVIAFEILSSIALIIGFKARFAAFMVAGFSIVSAIMFHNNFGDQMQFLMFLKNVSIAGGCMMIVAYGAGAYSLDQHQAIK